MHRYKIAHFQNTLNQQPVDPQITNQLYLQQQQQPRRTPIRSGIVTGLMGLAGGIALHDGINIYRTGQRFNDALKTSVGLRESYPYYRVRSLLTQSKVASAFQVGGAGLALGGGYLLGKTARRIIRGIRNRNNQLAVENNQYNQPIQ